MAIYKTPLTSSFLIMQVEPQEKKKKTPKGRAKKRMTYTRRFVNVTMTGGKRKVRTSTLTATLIALDSIPFCNGWV
jgi:hypothetical protein